MKTKIQISSVALIALCGTLQTWAAPAATDNATRNSDQYRRNQNALGQMEKANRLIGMEIQDAQGNKVGKIKDLAVDLENGRIVEVIAATGGVLGVDERLVAVPPSQFTYNPGQNAVRLESDPAQLKSANSFKMSNWQANVQQESVTGVYQHYGDKPYYASDQDRPQDTTTTASTTVNNYNRFGRVQRADKIIGSVVRNNQNDKIGKVENLMVDLPAGRVVEVVVSTGGFIGIGDELSAVPPQSFHQDSDRETLTLDTTKEALAQAPHFKSSEWPNGNNPDQARHVYSAYNVQPYFTTTGAAVDNSRQNVQDRNNDTLTPTKQSSTQTDTEVTRRIRRDIVANKNLSVNAHNVKVITVDGRVTLRGPVKSDDEKRQIEEIVTKDTAPGNVDNQLQVESAPASNQVNQ